MTGQSDPEADYGDSATGTWTIQPHDHDDRYYAELELQSPAAAIVHWDNLISVPAGLHDSDDDSLATSSCTDVKAVALDCVP